MKTLDEVLEIMEARIDRQALLEYIAREWVRPERRKTGWHFEEIDIARLQLIYHLAEEIKVNEEGMDVALSLLDQLYGLRAHMQKLAHAIAEQPPQVQTEITMILKQLAKAEETL